MTAAFGSDGAGRMLAAVDVTEPGWRRWEAGGVRLSADAGIGRAYWYLENSVECWRVPRDTARLILRGLLAEGVARELATWLDERDAREALCAYEAGQDAERDEVRAKLHELGVL